VVQRNGRQGYSETTLDAMTAYRRLLPALLATCTVAVLTGAPAAQAEDYHVMSPHEVWGDEVGSSGFRKTEEHAAWVAFLNTRTALGGTPEPVNCATLDPFRASACFGFDVLGSAIVGLAVPQ